MSQRVIESHFTVMLNIEDTFSVRQALRSKKQISVKYIIQHSTNTHSEKSVE